MRSGRSQIASKSLPSSRVGVEYARAMLPSSAAPYQRGSETKHGSDRRDDPAVPVEGEVGEALEAARDAQIGAEVEEPRVDRSLVGGEMDAADVGDVDVPLRHVVGVPVRAAHPELGRQGADLALEAGADRRGDRPEVVVEADVGLRVVRVDDEEEVAVAAGQRDPAAADEPVEARVDVHVELVRAADR